MNSENTTTQNNFDDIIELINSAYKIAIVGNAKSILNKSRDFSGYDLVVRMNKGVCLTPEQHAIVGYECDLYCGSGNAFLDVNEFSANVPEFRLFMTNQGRDGRNTKYFYPLEDWKDDYNQIAGDHRPTTGFMVWNMCLKYKAHDTPMDIYGMDFFNTNSFPDSNGASNVHSPEIELVLFQKALDNNENIRIIA